MKKKRLTKGDKKVIKTLISCQLNALNSLRSRLLALQLKTEELLKKIETSGINTNYSSNSDLAKVAEEIFRLELRLSEFKQMQMDIEYGKKV